MIDNEIYYALIRSDYKYLVYQLFVQVWYHNDHWRIDTNISLHLPDSGSMWPHSRYFYPCEDFPFNTNNILKLISVEEFGGLDARGLDGLGHGNILRYKAEL